MGDGHRIRVRHGVYADPMLGYRPVREVDGTRRWIGPWTTEAKADAIATSHAQRLRDAIAATGAHAEQGDTPLDLWIPVTSATTPQEPHDG